MACHIVYHVSTPSGRDVRVVAEIAEDLEGDPIIVECLYDDLRSPLEGEVDLTEDQRDAIIDIWYQTHWVRGRDDAR